MLVREKVPKSFCTTHEAAQILGVTIRTIQLWAENGMLACWKTEGGHRRIPRASIDRLLCHRPAAEAIGAPPLAADEAASPLRILVAEDEPTLLRLYRLQLARWPIKPLVTTASNGIETLVRLGIDRPDLLIADLNMPAMDGFQMLRTLRRMPEMDDLEIVVVTGLSAAEIAAGGLPAGMPVLEKPIPFDELERMASALAIHLGRKTPLSGGR